MNDMNPSSFDKLGRLSFPEGQSGIVISALQDQGLLEEIRALVSRIFPEPTQYYIEMDPDAYRALILQGQEELNASDFGRRLAQDRRGEICAIMNTQAPMIQTNIYLRATRPSVTGIQENIGWHRESFYGPNMEESVNFWMPIANATKENAVRYIPESHQIPDADIETTSKADDSVSKFSAGHKIGLLYAPKEIVNGVDLSASQPLLVPDGSVALFAGALIHGAAANNSDQIRFSIDFRMVAQECMAEDKEHFASGKSYFELL
ncbi:MAG: phytanoyl-CoA dioxygenase family protein [Pseudomonadota bacterium]